jgi:hypothetical protein
MVSKKRETYCRCLWPGQLRDKDEAGHDPQERNLAAYQTRQLSDLWDLPPFPTKVGSVSVKEGWYPDSTSKEKEKSSTQRRQG